MQAEAAGAGAEQARLEYWAGLLLIHAGREVEGTLALERAGVALERQDLPQPTLEGLFQELGLEFDDLTET
ncbi:hypothetical protein [Oceanithermus sp.]